MSKMTEIVESMNVSNMRSVDWLEIVDPDDKDQRWKLHVPFLLSNWECLFGRGCPGNTEVPHNGGPAIPAGSDVGCCQHGAYLEDHADRDRLAEHVAMLTEDDLHAKALAYIKKNGYLVTFNEDEDKYNAKTKVRNGACVFANRYQDVAEGDDPNRIGCAFIHLAARLNNMSTTKNVDHTSTMPKVCWQLPFKVDHNYDDYSDLVTTVIYPWDAAQWSEGGQADYLEWWCVAEGSLITTERGQVPIQEVTEEDRVLTRVGYRKVLRLWDNGVRPVVKVMHEGGSIVCTDDHKLLTSDGSWVEASALACSADTVSASGANPSVLWGHRVPLGTDIIGLPPEGSSPQRVLVSSDGLDVPQVHANGVAAQVVEFPASEKFAPNDGVQDNVSGHETTVVGNDAGVTASDESLVRQTIPSVDEVVLGEGIGNGFHSYTVHHRIDAGMAHVYDLTVEGQHEYIADGVVVHNCVNDGSTYTHKEPLFLSGKAELTALMGEAAYALAVEELTKRWEANYVEPMPAVGPNGRKMLPLEVAPRG